MKDIKLSKVKIKNTSSIDMMVRDAYGKEYILFPSQEKEISIISKDEEKICDSKNEV